MADHLALVPATDIVNDPVVADVAGQLGERSQRIYYYDLRVFATWLTEQGLTVQALTPSNMIAYRVYLAEKYAKSTATRMLSVARRLLAEQVKRHQLEHNPAVDVRGFKGEDETPHVALTGEEAQRLLDSIEIKTLRGLRDYVLILFLLRTGVRRSEAAALTRADLTMRQGHHIAVIQHGKGDTRRIVKIPVDVWREIEGYLEALRQYHAERCRQLLDALEQEQTEGGETEYQVRREAIVEQHTMAEHDGLFVRIRRGDHPTREAMTDRSIAEVVEKYAGQIDIDGLSPHGLRASFITLTLESGATLEQTQYAAGHRDPRTTERYRKRKLNLDQNAVDTLHFVRKHN